MSLIIGILFFLSPTVKYGSYGINLKYLAVLIICIFILKSMQCRPKVSSQLFHVLAVFIVFLIYFSTRMLFSGSVEYDYFAGTLQIIFLILAGYSLSNNYGDEHIRRIFAKIFFMVMTLNSLVILLQYFSTDIKVGVESVLAQGPLDFASRSDRFRGIAAGGGASLSFSTGVSLVVGYWLLGKGLISKSVLGFSSIVSIGAIFLIGKSGFLVVFIFLIRFFNISFFKYLFYGALIFSSILFFMPDSFDQRLLNRNFAMLFGGSDASVRGLKEFYDFSEAEFFNVFVGSGFYNGDLGGGNTDPGLFKLISLGGFLPSVAFYFFFLYSSLKVGAKDKKLWRFLIFIFIVFELKEPLLFKGYAMNLLWLWYGSYLVGSKLTQMRKAS